MNMQLLLACRCDPIEAEYVLVAPQPLSTWQTSHHLPCDSLFSFQASGGGIKPLFLGRRFKLNGKETIFNSGGAGYLLNGPALRLLNAQLTTEGNGCNPHLEGFWEDVMVASCLRVGHGVVPYDTKDSLGRERFHPFTPGHHFTYQAPKKGHDWYVDYSIDLKFGYDCCSEGSTTFHYMTPELTRRMYALWYGHCG